MKTTRYVTLIGLLLLTLLTACSEPKSSEGPSQHKSSENSSWDDKKPSLVVVLCDVSNSVAANGAGTENLTKVIAEAQRLLSCFPAKSTLFYLPISDNALGLPIADFTMTSYSPATKRKLKTAIDTVSGKLNRKLDSLSKVAGHNTCILTSIETGYKLLLAQSKNAEYSNHQYKLIILSDMLEACLTSRAGPVRIKYNDTISMNKAASLFNQFKPEINFKSLEVEVLVFNPSHLTPLVKTRLENTWKSAFARMQYGKADQIEFTPELRFLTKPGL